MGLRRFTEEEIESILSRSLSGAEGSGAEGPFSYIRFRGLMGMATNTDDVSVVEADFARIEAFKKSLEDRYDLPDFTELSIGMSHDWPAAIRCGANMVRIGTAIFGPRVY